MYCLISLILFIGAVLNLNQVGDFEQFYKLCIISGLFGLCDSISSLSIKRFFEYIKTLSDDHKEENSEK